MSHNSKIYRSASLLLAILLLALITRPVAANFTLRVQTDLGSFDIELFDTIAPLTVANFMNYVNDGDYEGTFFHRAQEDLFVQGGGFVFDGGAFFAGGVTHIPEDPPVVNEFNLSNIRGTIAMAKLAGDTDSATSEWFVNLADNSAILDVDNGGFTVFAQVLGDGLEVLDEISSLTKCFDFLPPFVCGGFTDTPTVDPQEVFSSNDVLVNISHIGFDNDGDGAIDSLEDLAPNGGDGNSDTILDSTQNDVASFQGVAGDTITIVAPATNTIGSLDVLGVTFAINTTPASECVLNGLEFRHGYSGFAVSGMAPGGTVDIEIILPAGDIPETYYLNGPTPTNNAPDWYEFLFDPATGTGATFSGNVVTLHLVDGGLGDSDQSVNGVIEVSPGGPAVIVSPVDLDDDDCDGVLDKDESGAPNNGDGNLDGIKDSLQANVASLVDTTSDSYVTVEIPSTSLLGVIFFSDAATILAQSSDQADLTGLNFTHGFLNMTVENVGLGGSVKIKLYLTEKEKPVKFFKYGPTPGNPDDHLYEFDYNGVTGAEINGNVITLHFVDGKRGDADLTVNGIIDDPGTPAIKAGNTGASSGGGGGGCVIDASAKDPKKAAAWFLVGLFLILLGLYRSVRRSR